MLGGAEGPDIGGYTSRAEGARKKITQTGQLFLGIFKKLHNFRLSHPLLPTLGCCRWKDPAGGLGELRPPPPDPPEERVKLSFTCSNVAS